MYNKAQKLAGTKNDPSGLTGKAAQATLAKMAAKAKSKTKSSSSKKYKTTGMSSK